MKKILFVVPLPPPIHGASYINLSIKNSKKINKNFQNFFFNSSQITKLEEIEIFKVKKLIFFIFSYFKLIIKIIIINPHIIYFNPSPRGIGFYRDIFFIILFKLFNKKLIFHLHGVGFNRLAQQSKSHKKFLKILFKNVSLICLSRKLVKDIHLIRDKKKNLFILNNFSKKNYSKLKKNKNFTFLFLSNLFKQKGILTFLNSIKKLNNKKYDFKAIVIGNNKNDIFFTKVKEIINKLDNVKYLGPLYGKKKDNELKKSNVLVFPTKHSNETFSLVVLESMSSGTPVITSSIGALTNIIDHKKNGFLLKKNNIDECVKYMEIFLKNKNLYKKYGKVAKKKYEKNYTFDIFEDNLINILNKI